MVQAAGKQLDLPSTSLLGIEFLSSPLTATTAAPQALTDSKQQQLLEPVSLPVLLDAADPQASVAGHCPHLHQPTTAASEVLEQQQQQATAAAARTPASYWEQENQPPEVTTPPAEQQAAPGAAQRLQLGAQQQQASAAAAPAPPLGEPAGAACVADQLQLLVEQHEAQQQQQAAEAAALGGGSDTDLSSGDDTRATIAGTTPLLAAAEQALGHPHRQPQCVYVTDEVVQAAVAGDSAAMEALHLLANGNGMAPHLPDADGSESDDGDWDMGGRGSGSGSESEDGSDGYGAVPRRYCVNCTHCMMEHIEACEECGHLQQDDIRIFTTHPAGTPALHAVQRQQLPAVLCFDERMVEHDEGKSSPHPERPDRIRAVMARLSQQGLLDQVQRLPCREATREEIETCHTADLVEAVAAVSGSLAQQEAALKEKEGGGGRGAAYFTPDTYVNQHTYQCARLSAGGCVSVATAVAKGEARTGVAVVRPPGHHAESNTAMGFCFFNNAAIAARAAQAAGARRVLILDWDVHHGNGTQHIFEEDDSVMYMSVHRYDGGLFYPGTGAASEVGRGQGEGCTVNVPWLCGGMTDGDYLAAFSHVLLPIAYEFAPDLLIVSAGFDAAAGDPIGGCAVTPQGFAHMASLLQGIAPMAVLLEGGYNLSATAASVESVVRVLLGERPPALPGNRRPSPQGMAAIKQAVAAHSDHWACMSLLHNVAAPDPLEAAEMRAEMMLGAGGDDADDDDSTPTTSSADEDDARAGGREEGAAPQAELALAAELAVSQPAVSQPVAIGEPSDSQPEAAVRRRPQRAAAAAAVAHMAAEMAKAAAKVADAAATTAAGGSAAACVDAIKAAQQEDEEAAAAMEAMAAAAMQAVAAGGKGQQSTLLGESSDDDDALVGGMGDDGADDSDGEPSSPPLPGTSLLTRKRGVLDSPTPGMSPGQRELLRAVKRQRQYTTERKWRLLNALHISALRTLMRKQARKHRAAATSCAAPLQAAEPQPSDSI